MSIDYENLVQDALRCIVREVLTQTARDGLSDDHHFYIAFATDYPGVMIPEYLKDEYGDEITIVLQHEYWDLSVELDRFSVTLSFNDIDENLVVPFAAITSFVDPSVKFGLQFTPVDIDEPEEDVKKETTPKTIRPTKPKKAKSKDKPVDPDDETPPESNVVPIDLFRKK
jgi:hypothetical protein